MNGQQQGLSLIELLISMTLGIFLIGGTLQFYLSSKQTFLFTEQMGDMEENSRFSLHFLVKDIRMAGYANPEMTPMPIPILGGCTHAWCTENGSGLNSDRIAVQFDPTENMDCNGNSLGEFEIVTNVYWVEDDASNNNIPTLFCRGFNPQTGTWLGNAEPLVEGVETLQLLYGETSGSSETPANYVPANKVNDWNSVAVVRVGILSQSEKKSLSGFSTKRYTVLDSEEFEFSDGKTRTLYTTAIAINNQI